MRLIVADTGPLDYLVLIGEIDVLPRLFEKIYVPSVVRNEMTDDEAPPLVQQWAADPPAWVEVLPVPVGSVNDPSLSSLDDGEKAAIALAASLRADLILMDDREGAAVARQMGFAVTGTIGILDLASRRGLVDLAAAFSRLKATNFRYPQEIIDTLLAQFKKRNEG